VNNSELKLSSRTPARPVRRGSRAKTRDLLGHNPTPWGRN